MPRKKQEEKRKAILDSAVKVFAKDGFHNAKIGDVASEAGVAHGTIYLYFDSKDDLLISIFQECLTELLDYMRSEIQKETNAEGKFRKAVSLQMDIIETNPELTQLILVELPRTGRFLDNSVLDLLSAYVDMVAEILKEGIEEKIFNSKMNVRLVATMIYSGLQGIATRWILEGREYPLNVPVSEISEIILKGLKTPR